MRETDSASIPRPIPGSSSYGSLLNHQPLVDVLQESMSTHYMGYKGFPTPPCLYPLYQRPGYLFWDPEQPDIRKWAGMDHQGYKDWSQYAACGT